MTRVLGRRVSRLDACDRRDEPRHQMKEGEGTVGSGQLPRTCLPNTHQCFIGKELTAPNNQSKEQSMLPIGIDCQPLTRGRGFNSHTLRSLVFYGDPWRLG
jgi:hypothetical protein